LILGVDDEEAVRAIACSVLEKAGYRAIAAQSPAAALDMARKASEGGGEAPDLLLTDVVMPGMDGRKLHDAVREKRPGLKCLYMSGYPADVIVHQGVLDEGLHYIQKPFTRAALAERLRRILGGAGGPAGPSA
jgi:CheY-like chemotaxis protein